MEIYEGGLEVCEIQNRWYLQSLEKNCGALLSFVGIVRAENGIQALSFDIYEPLLKKWLSSWQEKAKLHECEVFFAHSKGDVPVHKSSFVAGILSQKRKNGLKLLNDFVEDFKANAPIWKYDIINGKRIYALNRSKPLKFAGLLAK
ncbi:MAG: molybdenum cofactor biosynthesis protein MoaE [Campylobacter sp.]|nr:molybdenum cofactor biosynthesis protein MoaE [Campylobacter sp.]